MAPIRAQRPAAAAVGVSRVQAPHFLHILAHLHQLSCRRDAVYLLLFNVVHCC